ncbi:MAG: C39 family peptidase [Minisyncoccia bacterium]
MKLKIPYHSQFDEITMLDWKEKGCSVTCLKMCLDFAKSDAIPSIDSLIKEGIVIGGYLDGIGWRHDALVRLAHNYGVPAYAEEFKSVKVDVASKTFSQNIFENDLLDIGVRRIRGAIERNVPVIVSISRQNGSHQIVVVGFEDNLGATTGFYINDPDNRLGERKEIFVPISEFLTEWRKFAVFVG